ncbi:hypothetical protein [Acinetobacter baumannii]|uniref:hypothetical protein n=1 Tax=Acinetobacter baumannii TaxID=470 RepID=UPI00208FD5FD|nr:hypothetical protein [Acinetobacter baumannii]
MDKKALLEQFKAEVEASGTSLTHILKMCEFDEVSNDFRSDTIHDYSIGCLNGAWWMFQRQQAKVEELEGKLKQAYEDVDTFAEAHERECGFKAQLAKDKAELQKRVDKALELMQKPLIVGEPAKYVCARFKEIEQALKGDQYDEHHKKAEEAISKGASLTNHRIEL